jgi:hypothetical protein
MRFVQLGMILAGVATVLWGITEPRVSLAGGLRSVTWGVAIFAAWLLVCWVLHPGTQHRDLRNRLKRTDWGGS